MPQLAPSILSADFGRLEKDLKAVENAGADVIHVDVMDGHFVPNITIGPVVVEAVKRYTRLPLDVHLMIENPQDYAGAFIDAGASWISFHQEATDHAHRLVQKIKDKGVKVGLAVNPGTPVESLTAMLDYIDYVLIMSVNPGFGGQSFIGQSISKIRRLKDMVSKAGSAALIEVDGGVTIDNAAEIITAGADILVAGSAVFGAEDIGKAVHDFNDIFQNTGP